MLTYEQWDVIADAVVPTLGLLALLIPIWAVPNKQRLFYFIAVVAAVGLTVSLRALNHSTFAIWPLLGVQYSGHTGTFMVAAVSLIFWRTRLAAPVAVVFVLYSALMLYQQYHTIGDILLTAAVMGPATWFIHVAMQALGRKIRGQASPV